MRLRNAQNYDYQIYNFLHLMKSKNKNVVFEYELFNESEFETNIDDRKGFEVKSPEDVLSILRIAKIDNGITLAEINKLRIDKGYVIGDILYLILIAKSKYEHNEALS